MSETALSYGAEFDDWNDFEAEYATPLHAIAATGDMDSSNWARTIQYFLDKGYSIDERDDSGYSPFLLRALSMSWTNAEQVGVWVRAGAEVNATDIFGCNAFHLLARQVHTSWSSFLFWDHLCSTIWETQIAMRGLIRAGCNPYHTDSHGRTPTMYMRHCPTEQLFHLWLSVLEDEQQLIPEIDISDDEQQVNALHIIRLNLANYNLRQLSCPSSGCCWMCKVGEAWSDYRVDHSANEDDYKVQFHKVWCLRNGQQGYCYEHQGLGLIYRPHELCGICFTHGIGSEYESSDDEASTEDERTDTETEGVEEEVMDTVTEDEDASSDGGVSLV